MSVLPILRVRGSNLDTANSCTSRLRYRSLSMVNCCIMEACSPRRTVLNLAPVPDD